MNKKTVYLTLIVIVLVFMATKLWTQTELSHNLLPYPVTPNESKMLEYERSLCPSTMKPIAAPSHWKAQCPQKPIVTVRKLGRLGNQMWEYISVWAVAKKTGREAYVPSCLIQELEKVFQNLTVPPLSYIAHCAIEKYPVEMTVNNLTLPDGNILLHNYVQLPHYVVPLLSEVRQIFQFKKHYTDTSNRILCEASKGVDNVTYVGIHVRRTDYGNYLKKKYKASLVKPDFFLRQMKYFQNNYEAVIFVVVSDDPEWCERELSGNNVVVMRKNSPAMDLAIMTACNYSIIDYGTYGVWGALLAGGDTFVYNLTQAGAVVTASLLANWHIVT